MQCTMQCEQSFRPALIGQAGKKKHYKKASWWICTMFVYAHKVYVPWRNEVTKNGIKCPSNWTLLKYIRLSEGQKVAKNDNNRSKQKVCKWNIKEQKEWHQSTKGINKKRRNVRGMKISKKFFPLRQLTDDRTAWDAQHHVVSRFCSNFKLYVIMKPYLIFMHLITNKGPHS